LQLFLHRTRTLHTLLAEAETTSNLPDKNWKLPPGKRAKLAALLGETPETQALKPKKSKILKFTGFAIAACAILTAFLITLINPHTFQQKAAEIVTYQTTGNGPAPEQAQANIEELKRLVQEQEDKVEERRKVLATISRTKNIAHRGERQLGLEEDRVARYAEVKVNELETKTTELETQIESLSSFDDSQLLIYASGLDLPDNVIKTLYPQTRELERQIDGLKASGLSEKHPKVVTNKRVLDSMNKDLGEGVINLRSRLQDQLRQSKEQLAKAEARRDESKRDSVEKNIDTLEWIDAKKDFETDLATLEQLELKLNAATIEAEISSQTTNSHASGRIAKNPKTPRPKRQSSVNSSTGAPSIPPAPPESEALAKNEMNFDDGADFGRGRGYETPSDSTPESAIDIGGMVEKPGSLEFKEGTTLGEAIASAGGATEFGSEKRVKLYREGKVKTYDVTDSSLAQLKLQPGDTIEMPQKNWLGCGASRDEAILSESTQQRDKSELSKDPATAGALTAGRRSGEQAIASESTEDTLNIPDRAGSLAMFENTGGETDETQPDAFSSPQDEKSNVRSLRIVEAELKALKDEIEDPSINDSKKQHLFGVWQKKQQEAIASQNQLGDAAIAKAKQLRMEGKHEEALAVLDTANKENFRTEFGYLDDTISSNSSFYKEHKKNVEDVRRNLHLADGNFDLGKYDEAKDSYEQILRTDPYNQAARRGMERIAATKSDYYRAAYDQTRAELLMKVDDAWELSVPAEADSFWGDNLSSSEALTFYKPQIDITTKFVETNQTNNRELGIGWLFRPSQNEPEVAGFDGFMNYGRPIADTADPFADESDDALRERHAYLKKTIEAPIQIKKQALFKEWKEINQELARREAAKPTLTDLSQESPASQDPFSTFSLNISDTSFQLARAAIA
ncbi:MAG: SLBB domain-containing protein, partial [Luteolibacter sp.]